MNGKELNESELFEKCYLLLLSRIDVSKIDHDETVSYPSDEEHPLEDETDELSWVSDITIKICRLADVAVSDIMDNRKKCQTGVEKN